MAFEQDQQAPPDQPRPGGPKSSDFSDTIDKDAAKRLMDRCVNDASNNSARQERDKQDWQNLLFDRGGPDNQYIIFDTGTNSWVTRGDDPKKGGLPPWMPRPVTNILANKVDAVAAILDQSKPAQTWKPNTDDDDDLATSEVCENALPVLYDEIEYESHRPEINRAVCLTDKILAVPYYDNDTRHGEESVLALQCPACGDISMPADLGDENDGSCANPECQGDPDTGMPAMLQDAVDPQGNPIGQTYPVGKICLGIYQSFEFSLPSASRTHRKFPWALTHQRQAWEEAIREFPQLKDKKRDKVGYSKSSIQRHFADAMRKLSGPRAAATSTQGGAKSDEGPVIYRLWHEPITDDEFNFPEGLYCVMVADEIVQATPLHFRKTGKDGTSQPFINAITRTFRATPGSQFGKPIADDMVPLQYSRNLLEALLFAILLHNASPRTYMPLSVTLEKQPTGAPGEIIPFRSTTPGEGPISAPGMNPPEGLYKWIEQIDAKFDELSKLNGVLQGERPAGDPTLGEIQILKERGESSFSEPLLELVRFERELSRMLLWIAKDAIWTDRLRQVQGDDGQWEISQFNQADLQGDVDVQVDSSTAWPQSQMMKQLALKEAMEMGVFALLKQDPELATKLLEFYDLRDFIPSLDVNRKQVMRELDRWRGAHAAAEIAPPNPDTQDLPVHLLYKTNFLKTEAAEALAQQNPPVYQAMLAHVAQIKALIQQAQMAAAMAANPQPPAPPAKPGDQKPDGSALDHAIKSGALKPAGAEQAGSAGLEQLVGQGVLQPADAAQAAQPPAPVAPAGPSMDDLMTSGVLVPQEAADAAQLQG